MPHISAVASNQNDLVVTFGQDALLGLRSRGGAGLRSRLAGPILVCRRQGIRRDQFGA